MYSFSLPTLFWWGDWVFSLGKGIPLGVLVGEGAHLIEVDLAYTSTASPLGDLGDPLKGG